MQTATPFHAAWPQAIALAIGLIATTAQAQVASSFSVTLQRGTQSQVLQDLDYTWFDRFVANPGSGEQIDLPPVVLDRTILRTDTSNIFEADDGTQQVLQLVQETIRYTTQLELFTRLDENYSWSEAKDSLPDTAPAATAVTFDINTNNPRDRLDFYLNGQLLANAQGLFDVDQAFVGLIDGQPDASFTSFFFNEETGYWSAGLSLYGSTAGRTFSFQAPSNGYISEFGFGMTSRLSPSIPLEVVETRTVQNFELVAWNPTTPVPEPSTWALGTLGLGWLLVRGRKARALQA